MSISRIARPRSAPQRAVLSAALVMAWVAGWSVPAPAADRVRHACLNKEAQREAVASGQAVALALALRNARVKHKGELVRARLCRRQNGLVYVLTLLPRNGKVTRAFVDAASGQLVGSR